MPTALQSAWHYSNHYLSCSSCSHKYHCREEVVRLWHSSCSLIRKTLAIVLEHIPNPMLYCAKSACTSTNTQSEWYSTMEFPGPWPLHNLNTTHQCYLVKPVDITVLNRVRRHCQSKLTGVPATKLDVSVCSTSRYWQCHSCALLSQCSQADPHLKHTVCDCKPITL